MITMITMIDAASVMHLARLAGLATTTTPGTDPVRTWITPIVLVAGVVGIAVLLTISVRGKIARRTAARGTPRDRIERVKTGHEVRDTTNTGLSELLETSQRLAAQLDNKAERLEQLIVEAQETIALLDERLGGAMPAESAAPPPPRVLDPLTESVYQLADEGNSPVQIAQQLDEQVGKVELILALRG